MTPNPTMIGLSLPIPWSEFGFPDPFQTTNTALSFGDIGWSWEPKAPALPILASDRTVGESITGWDLDHVVLLVPEIEDAVRRLEDIGLAPRLRMEVRGRPTAFFRVGPLLEVIESPVRAPAIYGVALVTEEARAATCRSQNRRSNRAEGSSP
jgi:hypothetical protein